MSSKIGRIKSLRGAIRKSRGLTKLRGCEKIAKRICFHVRSFRSGPVAQLGARFHGMEEVVGSIPTRSTNFPAFKINSVQPNAAAIP